MKNKLFVSLILITVLSAGCRKYLDVNSDPANPQDPNILALLPPVFGNAARVVGLDGLPIGQYVQYYSFNSNTGANWEIDRHGGNTFGGAPRPEIWRRLYVDMGVSINLIIDKGVKEEYWDFVGVALAMKAWGFQTATDMCGELIYKQAWEPGRASFDYDDQSTVYAGIDSLCKSAISYLNRTDGKVMQNLLQRGDLIYGGDRTKWKKFVYGLLARNQQRLSNKPNYDPNLVLKYLDSSFTADIDNFLAPHTASRNDDTNIFGPARNNYPLRLQSRYITNLLDGTNFYGNSLPPSRDPRLSKMLTTSFDTSSITTTMPALNGGYRSLLPNSGDPEILGTPNSTQGFIVGTPQYRRRVSTLYGDSTPANNASGQFGIRSGKFVFQNNAPVCLMAYHELLFIRAEANMLKNDQANALNAYRSGITAHMNFVNRLNTTAANVTPITTTQINDYLASTAVKQTPATLTLTDIMLQKYIALFAWNPMETWCDMRRYHYFDLDPLTGVQVYRNYTIPAYSVNNLGSRPAYRFWPTDNSEFDWNSNALFLIGANNADYHTYEMWFTLP